jgi:presenilin-like A22 family membrane protease
MNTKTFLKLRPVVWSIIIFIAAQALTLLVASHQVVFLETHNIDIPVQSADSITFWPGTTTSPSGVVTTTPAVSSLAPILIYFCVVIVIMAAVLFFIPMSALKKFFKGVFAFLYCWSIFVVAVIWLPAIVSIIIAAAIALLWFFNPRVWLHSAVMLLAMIALGEVFGRLIAPWTAMILLAVLAIYDFLAVRFGFMLWMADKLSESSTLPAFIIPYKPKDWQSNLKKADAISLAKPKTDERTYSILGGGDIGFPVLLAAAVYFTRGLQDAVIVAAFSLVGLIGAYVIQAKFAKGKAVPALPPIAVFSLIGMALVSFVIK